MNQKNQEVRKIVEDLFRLAHADYDEYSAMNNNPTPIEEAEKTISDLLSKEREKWEKEEESWRWQEKVDNESIEAEIRSEAKKDILERLPSEKQCELCDYPFPECNCRGWNDCLNQIKESLC